MKKILLIVLSLLAFLSLGAKPEIVFSQIEWTEAQELCPLPGQNNQLGLAQPFAGLSGGSLIVAGGANFPYKSVVEGGKKKYHNAIYRLPMRDDTKEEWTCIGYLPEGRAYGVSLSYNDGVLCIGGCNEDQASEEVFIMKWEDEKIVIEAYPSLPVGICNMTGDIIDDVVYVVGGKLDGFATNRFFSLDLSDANANWIELQPMPGSPRIQPIMIAQNAAEEKRLYLFSGSSYSEDGEPQIMSDGLSYNPLTTTWSEIATVQPEGYDAFSLHGASAIATGTHHIMFVGGVNKNIFHAAWVMERDLALAKEENNTEELVRLEQQRLDYLKMPSADYNFNKEVLVYHTITDTWFVLSEYPFPAPAGAAMVKVDDGWYIINGEIKPGIRSPKVYFGKPVLEPNFGIVNWSVLILYLFAMLYLGYYFMKKESSSDRFFKGGGNIPWWVAGVSIFATMLSAITFMSIPAKTYATDWLYFPMHFMILVTVLPVVMYYLPFYRRLNVTTAYEYLEKRFNYASRFIASSSFIVFMIARMALVLFLPSLVLTTVTGIDIYYCIILMGIITIIYCTMGGIEAVVWGDFIQGVVLLGGAIVAIIFLSTGTEGGFGQLMDITVTESKLKTFDFALDFSKPVFWVTILGGFANNLISYSSDQAVIQRYLTTKDEKSAVKSVWMNGFTSLVVGLLFYFIGTALYSFYKTSPELNDMFMTNSDAIFPHFVMSQMPIGVAGLLIAAIFSATMSTVSSNINSVSTAFTADFYDKFVKRNGNDKKRLRFAKIVGILSGFIGVVFALMMATMDIYSLLDYFNTILGLLASGLAGMFIMGIFFKRIHSVGAISGLVLGTIILFVIKNTTDIHFLLYGCVGIISSVSTGYLVSLFLPAKMMDLKGLTYKTLE